MTLTNVKAAEAAIVTFGFLTFGCTCMACAEEAGGTIIAEVVSPRNIAEIDFDENTVCQGGDCLSAQNPYVEKRLVCKNSKDAYLGACEEKINDNQSFNLSSDFSFRSR